MNCCRADEDRGGIAIRFDEIQPKLAWNQNSRSSATTSSSPNGQHYFAERRNVSSIEDNKVKLSVKAAEAGQKAA